jgi:hypothetical protein
MPAIKEPERHEIEELFPWHATGTLSRRDADRVEQVLAGNRVSAWHISVAKDRRAGVSL